MLVTDEYIRLLDCNHIYHRICLIHKIAQLTNKRFFLTRKEQKAIQNQPLSLCPNCKSDNDVYGYLKVCNGYRKHIIFDLLKDKADLFYQKMEERRAVEKEADANSNQDDDNLSQDSENYDAEQLGRDVDEKTKKTHEEPILKIKWKNVKNS